MSNRWKMNRIGFVNFWLYDEEIFEFVDGKLLLRGQNGSGKSITTQSFIPFILDGDRTPSRLDPFGSSDRRMEYYFLGEEGKEESTGYLFLEFKKEHSEEYRTIGIGQRARRGKPMDFWGFVILDGRRIGFDIQLYKETGSTKLPYDKQGLKKLLGEQTPFSDVPGEYKSLVNKYIFGFRRAEHYEQFIKLLVKVRAPKLSKELKPTKVYEILNESLQTLTDEDLRAMVDAMEKMDGIQENLEQLGRAFFDVKIIRNEYNRYNQFMLARKGQAYLKEKREVEEIQKTLEKQQEEKQAMQEEFLEKKKRTETLEDRTQLLEAELNSLLDTDMEEADRKLEKARKEKADAEQQKKKWEGKINTGNERIRESETKLKKLQNEAELNRELLREEKELLEDCQTILLWEKHQKAVELLEQEKSVGGMEEIALELRNYKNRVLEAKNFVENHVKVQKEYDEYAKQLEELKEEKQKKEQEEKNAQKQVLVCQDDLIEAMYQLAKNEEWKPSKETLLIIEQQIRNYEKISDESKIQKILRADYEQSAAILRNLSAQKEQEKQELEIGIQSSYQKLEELEKYKELEPFRKEEVVNSRKEMQEAGILCIPFFKAVEFGENVTEQEIAQLEAQLERMGILDALVVAKRDINRVRKEFPKMQDSILFVEHLGSSAFNKLIVNEEIDEELKEQTALILSHIYEEDKSSGIIFLGKNGYFQHGAVLGRAEKNQEPEFIGRLTRKRKKERFLQILCDEIEEAEQKLEITEREVEKLKGRYQILEQEYHAIPVFEKINFALEQVRICEIELQNIEKQYHIQEKKTTEYEDKKNQCYQKMLQHCKQFPYGRTIEEYKEVTDTLEEYQQEWQSAKEIVQKIQRQISDMTREKDMLEREEQEVDDAYIEKRRYLNKIAELEIELKKYEEYLNSPEIKEKTYRIEALKKEKKEISLELKNLTERLIQIRTLMGSLQEREQENRISLQEKIRIETFLRKYFEEELALNLVIERNKKSITECAKEAVGILRAGDRAREPEDLFTSLHRVYQQHSSTLSSYAASMENYFEETDEGISATRRRACIVFAWNGKKLYLEEFYQTLKSAIEETELLIQENDRDLFEKILSQTIGQQLTERIAESRKWVQDMSKLMKSMDTSMGLSFSLDWKPKTAESEQELDIMELEHILLRDKGLLTPKDIERVAAHFRSRIRMEKNRLQEEGIAINYMDLVRDVLDYRKWFTFQMSFYRNQDGKKPLTNAAFNRFSGGEKAMAMYVPLFAAVNAQYQKAENADHPRMIALDEAFAGVDDKNISSMFELVQKLDFDYIMNSQALWGCYESVNGLKIAELLRPFNSQVITVIPYMWNGHERILDVQ